MNRKLTVAAFATTLAVAPVALAQSSWSPDSDRTTIGSDTPANAPGQYVDDRPSAGTYSGTPTSDGTASEGWSADDRASGVVDPIDPMAGSANSGMGNSGTAVTGDAPTRNPGQFVDDRAAAGTYSGAPTSESWNAEDRARSGATVSPGYTTMGGTARSGTAVTGDTPTRNPGQFVDDRPAAGTYSGAPTSQSRDIDDRARAGATMSPGSTTMGGTTGTQRMTEDGRVLVDLGRIPNFGERQGPGQNRTELMQTTLLNHFSSFGFEGVRDFRKQGEDYVADVSRGGRWMTIHIDATTGTISAVR